MNAQERWLFRLAVLSELVEHQPAQHGLQSRSQADCSHCGWASRTCRVASSDALLDATLQLTPSPGN
jgi:hypothetical protein